MTWRQIGLILAGLAAVATIIALFFAIFENLQSINRQIIEDRQQQQMIDNQATSIAYQATADERDRQENSSLSTEVALLEDQLEIQQTSASIRTSIPESAPTATAAADEIAQLSATSEAINRQKQIVQATQTALAIPLPTPVPPTQVPSPLRPHSPTSAGTGVLSSVTESDGLAPISQDEINRRYQEFQLINPDSSPNGCGVANFDASKIWFGSANQAAILINGVEVGAGQRRCVKCCVKLVSRVSPAY